MRPREAIASRGRTPFAHSLFLTPSEDWTAARMGVLERNVLRIGIHELERATVPAEVAISEAVELAKRYASDEAARLVNGILGRVARERAA